MNNKPPVNRGLGIVDQAEKIGSQPQSAVDHTKPGTKEHTILTALLSGSLNRFEAERIGDHALNSTVSVLRRKGHRIVHRREQVPTRFGKQTTVNRYWIPSERRGC